MLFETLSELPQFCLRRQEKKIPGLRHLFSYIGLAVGVCFFLLLPMQFLILPGYILAYEWSRCRYPQFREVPMMKNLRLYVMHIEAYKHF